MDKLLSSLDVAHNGGVEKEFGETQKAEWRSLRNAINVGNRKKENNLHASLWFPRRGRQRKVRKENA